MSLIVFGPIVVFPLTELALVHLSPLLFALAHMLDDFRDRINNDYRNYDKNRPESFGHACSPLNPRFLEY